MLNGDANGRETVHPEKALAYAHIRLKIKMPFQDINIRNIRCTMAFCPIPMCLPMCLCLYVETASK